MERVYFGINEKAAKLAKSMMSFSDYVEGSKTEEYKELCDRTYELAEKAIEARPEEADRIEKLAERYARKMADNFNKDSEIGCRCPSIMISGGSNFPVKKKQKQVEAWDKNMEEFKEIQKIRDKIKAIINGADIIRSSDKNAVAKLEKKLKEMEKKQEEMREANKAVRLKDVEKGNARLAEMGYSKEQIESLRTPNIYGELGYARDMLRNNNANIRHTRSRLEALKAEKERGTAETSNEFFRVKENTEAMRIQLFFDGKPEPEVRQIVKAHGFRWAPSVGAWQRQLNNNGRYAVKQVIEELRRAAS